jgi:hypothetical protein
VDDGSFGTVAPPPAPFDARGKRFESPLFDVFGERDTGALYHGLNGSGTTAKRMRVR